MKQFNLTQWALSHKQFIYYLIIVAFIGGIYSYINLGRMEDPDFTIRQMIVSVAWPGATAREMEEQVVDKIEKKLQETPGLDYLKSFSTPGQSVIYVSLKDDEVTVDEIQSIWKEVRNLVGDMKDTLPKGVVGPFFNDRFSDVFGCVFALTGDGLTYEEMRELAERIRRKILGIPRVKKVELLGVQAEKITVEMETNKLAKMGFDPSIIAHSLESQNAMTPSGMIETNSDRVYLRVNRMFKDLEDLGNVPLNVAGKTFRLGDISKITRGYSDPPDTMMFFNGYPAIGISVSMQEGGNILTLGKNLEQLVTRIQKDLPAGIELTSVFDQPTVVKNSIEDFVHVLVEAVIIVLIVCFISMGLRSGVVVTLCIPLVILTVFIVMKFSGIDLHKISLGALIVALGLLVDDAIIVIEMMLVKLEQGWKRVDAASFAYTATAYPRLTGALVTSAGFLPVGFSKGSASEFVGSLFYVVAIALIISWIVAGTAAPLIGSLLVKPKSHDEGHDIYDTPFYRWFKRLLSWCMRHRWLVIMATLVSLLCAVKLMSFVKKEFFPASVRPEVVVDIRLPQGASIKATEQITTRFAKQFDNDSDVINYSYYVGQGAPRFILTAEPVLPDSNFAQIILLAKDRDARERLISKANMLFSTKFSEVRSNVKIIKSGPSESYPVLLRVSGIEHDRVREIAESALEVMYADPNLKDPHLDWYKKNQVMHLDIDQDKVRALGLDNRTLAANLQTLLSGAQIAEFREMDKTVSVLFRIDANNRADLSQVKNLNVHVGEGRFVPLDQIARISYDAEDGLIWRRDLKPTITLQANVVPGVTGNDATQKVYANLESLRNSLPQDYTIEVAGTLESSNNASKWLMVPVPMMIIIIMTLLMFQLQSISKMIMTLLTAPMGLIGVSLALFLTGSPMGFVVQLGILALSGIIMRNSVILIDQIDQQLKAGESLWDAIINATTLRFRPIMLTAAAAILAMVPISFNVFWGPMAVAIGGGLVGATILTLLVLPAIYAAWYKVKQE